MATPVIHTFDGKLLTDMTKEELIEAVIFLSEQAQIAQEGWMKSSINNLKNVARAATIFHDRAEVIDV